MGKIVLYLAGGAMTGVFSAGVLKRLHELHFQDQVEAVYAVSSGALNGAYFLSGQAPLLEDIYTKELAKKDFVQTARILTRSEQNVIDLDYVCHIVRDKLKLDLDAFRNQSLPLFAKVMNTADDSIEYLDARDYGVFPVLQATACIMPFYRHSIQINDRSYADGAIKESIGLARVREKHPDALIVLVVNSPFRSGLRRVLSDVWSRMLLYAACDKRLFNLHMNSYEMGNREIRLALAEQNIFVVYPPKDFPVSYTTTDTRALKRGYDMGYETARYILPYIEKQSTVVEQPAFPVVTSVFPQAASAVSA